MGWLRRGAVRDWLLAAFTGLVIVALRAIAQPLLGNAVPFVFAFPGTAFAALRWGAGPGMLVAALCAVATASSRVPPFIGADDEPLQIGSFLVAAIIVSLLCGQARQVVQDASRASPPGTESPLTHWLRAVVWGAVLLPTTVFAMACWWGYERAQDQATRTVLHGRQLALRHLQQTLGVAAQVASLADRAGMPHAGAPPDPASLHGRLADMAAGVRSIVNVNVWDEAGRAVARSDLFPVDPMASVADRPYFLEQQPAPGRMGLSEVLIGRQTGLELINVTVRRSAPDGRFRGIVAVSLAPGYFRDQYRSLASETPGLVSFMLVRSDGAVLARVPATVEDGPEPRLEDGLLQMLRANPGGQALAWRTLDADGERLLAWRKADDFPAYVLVGYSRERLLGEWWRFVSLLAAILIPLTALLAYVSWVALRKSRWQLQASAELHEQMERRANAERSMLESQKLETLAYVTSGVAHDFNNLLAIVTASLHVIRKRHPALAEEKHVLAMGKAVQSGVRLTRQLLSFSRKQALNPETLQLQSWLPGMEGLIASTLGARIAWQVHVEADTAPVHIDVGELELALINLAVNARHAMPEGGNLRVRAHNEPAQAGEAGGAGTMVAISVRDSGVGIVPELLDKVLQPFFTTRARGVGSGLGLSQVQGFCTQAGGSVRIDSVVGEGTVVTMRLPAAQPVAPREEPPPPAPSGPGLRGTVLLVEDNDEVAASTELVLRSAGLDVVKLASGDAALAHLLGGGPLPDLVLSDIAMPGTLSGIDLAFQLKQRFPGLPVILNTGYAEQVAQAAAGGLRVLQKPLAPEELLREIGELLRAEPDGAGA